MYEGHVRGSTESGDFDAREVPEGRQAWAFLSMGVTDSGLHQLRRIPLAFHLPARASKHVFRTRFVDFAVHQRVDQKVCPAGSARDLYVVRNV